MKTEEHGIFLGDTWTARTRQIYVHTVMGRRRLGHLVPVCYASGVYLKACGSQIRLNVDDAALLDVVAAAGPLSVGRLGLKFWATLQFLESSFVDLLQPPPPHCDGAILLAHRNLFVITARAGWHGVRGSPLRHLLDGIWRVPSERSRICAVALLLLAAHTTMHIARVS